MGVDLTTIAYNAKGLNHRNWGKMVVGFPRVYISIPLLLRDMCFFDLQATHRRSERRRWFLGERSRPSPRSVMCAGESFCHASHVSHVLDHVHLLKSLI